MPADYRAFMATYGAGGIENLVILAPLAVDFPQWSPGTIIDTTSTRALVERRVGRMARRDIWLASDGQLWRVRGRLGGDGRQEVSYDFTGEASARSMVDRMMKASAGTWRDLTEAVRQESNRRTTH